MKKRQIICVFAQRQFRQYIVVDPNKEKVQVKVEVPTTGRLLSLTMIFCHMAGGRVVELTVIFARLAKFEPAAGCSGEDISVRGSNSSGGKYRPLHQALTRVIYFCSQSWEMFRQEHNLICLLIQLMFWPSSRRWFDCGLLPIPKVSKIVHQPGNQNSQSIRHCIDKRRHRRARDIKR